MKQRLLLTITFIISLLTANGQDEKFIPSGKPVFLVFSNVHSSFSESGSNNAFELTRVYLGYEYSFSKRLSARANIDMGDPRAGDLQMTAYIKNAFLQYRTDKFSARSGMIGTDQYGLIEKHWGYRYIFKTLQDEYGFGPSADLGAAAEFRPSPVISFDASVLNGEGYKKLQSDSALKYTAGITITPVKGLSLRGYTDFMKKDYLQNSYSLFAGYTSGNFRIGAEYAYQKNNKMIDRHDLSGVSVWTSLKFEERFTAFLRYDNLWSSVAAGTNVAWNRSKDGQLFTAGVDYEPVKGIKIAPVYSGWSPSDSSKDFTSTIGLYFEIRL